MPDSASSLGAKEAAIPWAIVLLGTWIRGESLWIICQSSLSLVGFQASDTCPLAMSLVQEIRYKMFTGLSPCCFGSISDILALHRQRAKEPFPGLDQ